MVASKDKDESSVLLLQELQHKVHSSNASIRRKAAYNLAWLQEDGLDVLKNLLFGDYPITTKNAAAYGLRKTQGRMKKMALDVFLDGLKDNNIYTVQVCRNALTLLGHQSYIDFAPIKQQKGFTLTKRKIRIIDIPYKYKAPKTIDTRQE
jgi:hypothetical protein